MAWSPRFSLLPPRCGLCTGPAPPTGLCDGCRADLPLPGPACRLCAEPLANAVDNCCARCALEPPPWSQCRAVLPYAWPVDAALNRLKHAGDLTFAPALGSLLAATALVEFTAADALCPVPLHRYRHWRRGFNQAYELCRPLLAATGLPLVHGVRRVRHTPAQQGLDVATRRRNLAAAFALRGRLGCRRPLVVDDVMTTGETCRQLALALLAAGADAVDVLVLARAAPPGQRLQAPPGPPEKL